MEYPNKIVQFEDYCETCMFLDQDEADPRSQCSRCLENAVNEHSHKPVCYKEKTR